MSYINYKHSHTRERSRSRDHSPLFSTPALVRRHSKHAHIDLYNDDEWDDYPYASNTKPSRALTIREPSQLERLNIWSSPTHTYSHRRQHRNRSDDDDEEEAKDSFHARYRHVHSRAHSPSPSDDNDSDRHREFRLKIKAAVSIPNHHHHHHHHHSPTKNWPADFFQARSKERWMREDFEARERARDHDDRFWDEQPRVERKVTYRKIKRTRTDEWKPLSGFGRF